MIATRPIKALLLLLSTQHIFGAAEMAQEGNENGDSIPIEMLPSKSRKLIDSPDGDFIVPEDAKPGWIDPIRWKNDGEVVTANAYLLGLSTNTRESLLRYAEVLGALEIARKVTYQGQGLLLGEEEELSLQGMRWLLQATDGKYNSDMHW